MQKGKAPYPNNNLFKEVIIEDENEENMRNPSNQYSRLSGNSGNQSGNNNLQKKAKRGYGIEQFHGNFVQPNAQGSNAQQNKSSFMKERFQPQKYDGDGAGAMNDNFSSHSPTPQRHSGKQTRDKQAAMPNVKMQISKKPTNAKVNSNAMFMHP